MKENDDLASYNTLRSKILEDAINETSREWIIKNSDTKYVNYKNEQMTLGNYIIYKYAEIRYREFLTYPGHYSKEEIRTLEFQKKLIGAYQNNKKWIINKEGHFNDHEFYIPMPRNIENVEKEILRDIVSQEPEFLEKLKENIKEKCLQYDINPEKFVTNIGQEKIKELEDNVKIYVESVKKKFESVYNEYMEKITTKTEENDLLKEFANIYQEFNSEINNMNIGAIQEKIENCKQDVVLKMKELYRNYYLNFKNLNKTDNIDEKFAKLPTLKELKELKDKYDIVNTEHFEHKMVVEKETGKQVTDSKLINDVNFAYLWRYAARIKVFANDDEGYAFNNLTEESYKFFVTEIRKQIKETGKIDSIKLFRQAQIHNLNYKYTAEIITKLFENKATIKKIENVLRDREILENNALEDTKELYGDELIATRIAQEQNNEDNKTLK